MGISSSILGLSSIKGFASKNIHGRMCSHHHMQSFYEKLSYRSVTSLEHPADLFQQLAALLKHALTFLGRSRPTGIRCRAFPGVVVMNMSAESTSWSAEENFRCDRGYGRRRFLWWDKVVITWSSYLDFDCRWDKVGVRHRFASLSGWEVWSHLREYFG